MHTNRLGNYLFEELVVDLFSGANFDSCHHSPGGNDNTAEHLW